MKELTQILAALEHNPEGVLATVVQVKGSAYRRPGARMLILPDGTRIGSVSGGCLEGDLARKAKWLTESDKAILRTYDTTSDEDAAYEFGLGCNGVIDVLLERVNPAYIAYLQQMRSQRQTAISATVIRGTLVGARQWLNADGTTSGDNIPGLKLAAVPQSRVETIAGSEIFLERINPLPALVLFGAGQDTVPLLNIATEMGWEVSAYDARPVLSNLEALPIPENSAVVLMTHSYPQDRALIPYLLNLPLSYLGILGPRSRTNRLFEELRLTPPPHLYAPVGLDIGAGSPETIALSIAAEIAATISKRPGSMLKNREAPIYDHGTDHLVIAPSA